MSEPIKVGDLVVQYKDCCGNTPCLGMIGTVVRVAAAETWCSACGAKNNGVHVFAHVAAPGAPITWVKRIPPLSELEGEKLKDEIPA